MGKKNASFRLVRNLNRILDELVRISVDVMGRLFNTWMTRSSRCGMWLSTIILYRVPFVANHARCSMRLTVIRLQEAQIEDKNDPTIVNYHTISAAPSTRPARHFCAVCGYVSIITIGIRVTLANNLCIADYNNCI